MYSVVSVARCVVVWGGVLGGCAPVQSTQPAPATAVPLVAVANEVAPAPASAPPPPSEPPVELQPARYPVRWTERIALKDLAGIDAALGEPIKPNGNELTLVPPGAGEGAKRSITTCVQYLEATRAGYLAQTTFDITQESFFLQRCRPLAFLRAARPSAVSYVSELRLDKDPLAVLPASLNPDPEMPTPAQEADMASYASLKEYAPRLVVRKKSQLSVELVDSEIRSETFVDIVAWGDYDHDGSEDVLLFEVCHSLEGSYRSYEHIVLTRRNAAGPLRVLHAER